MEKIILIFALLVFIRGIFYRAKKMRLMGGGRVTEIGFAGFMQGLCNGGSVMLIFIFILIKLLT